MDELDTRTTHYQPNNCDSQNSKPAPAAASEQTAAPLVTSAQEMELELPQIESVYSEYNQANTSDYNISKLLTELTEEQFVTTSETSPQVKPEHIQLVSSQYTAANNDDIVLNNEKAITLSETLPGIMETKLPQIKMVFSEYNETCDEHFGKIDPVTMSNSEQYELSNQIMETELPKITTFYSESDLSNNVDFVTANDQIEPQENIVQADSTKTDQSQIEIVFSDKNSADGSVFCNLDTVFSSNHEAIIPQTVNNADFQIKIASDHNKDVKLQGCEENNNSSITQALDRELPQITEIFSVQSPSTHGLMSTVSKTQSKEMEMLNSNQFSNKIFDKLNNSPSQIAATSSIEEMRTNSEACKQISIKQEIIDEDEELSLESCLNLKSELEIKPEEVDVKDEEKTPERNFECKECDQNFDLECNYRLHMIYHNKSKTKQCDECPFKCTKRIRMLIHLKLHTGERKVLCKVCKDDYYLHKEFEHFQTCPKPQKYNCDECEFSTNQKYRFVGHVRLHTGERLKCPRCDLSFLYNMDLRKHYKSRHVKEKPYQCHLCYKKFKMRRLREMHVLAYCDRKCGKCDYVSIYCTDFYEHVKEVHPFSKLKNKLKRYYRTYDKVMAKNSNNVSTIHIEPEFVNYESGPVEFEKYEISENSQYKEENIGYATEQIVAVKQNTDYELIQNIKYELIEGNDNCGSNSNYESINLGADYELMQSGKSHLKESAEENIECELEDNIDYDLIQNVACELTEGAEDYTLLCL